MQLILIVLVPVAACAALWLAVALPPSVNHSHTNALRRSRTRPPSLTSHRTAHEGS